MLSLLITPGKPELMWSSDWCVVGQSWPLDTKGNNQLIWSLSKTMKGDIV